MLHVETPMFGFFVGAAMAWNTRAPSEREKRLEEAMRAWLEADDVAAFYAAKEAARKALEEKL